MVYVLAALVGGSAASKAAELLVQATVPLSQGLSLLPIPETPESYSADEELPFGEEFLLLTPVVVEVAAAASEAGPLAYLGIEMHGGTGTRAAAVWDQGRVVYGPAAVEELPGRARITVPQSDGADLRRTPSPPYFACSVCKRLRTTATSSMH